MAFCKAKGRLFVIEDFSIPVQSVTLKISVLIY